MIKFSDTLCEANARMHCRAPRRSVVPPNPRSHYIALARRSGAAPLPRRRRGRRAGTRGARRRAARPPARARCTRARRAGSRAWPARRPRAPAGPARGRREVAVCVWVWGPACRVGARARSGIRPAHLACLTPASPLHLRTTQRSSAPAAKHATCFAEEAQRARCHLHGPLTLSSSVAF